MSMDSIIDKLFGKSYLCVVSSFVKDEKITLDELKELIDQIGKGKDK